MNSSAQFNALPLLSVKPALDSALEKIGDNLEQYFAGNGVNSEPLQEAISELHRAYGVLRMLSLDGVIVFCSELEKLLQEFAGGVMQPSAMHHEIIQRALLILTHYLNSLSEGAPNAALRLFDPYQELLQARGIEAAFEVDLFFPDLNVDLPQAVLAPPQLADAQARIKPVRSQYQMALLKWLRQDNVAESLQSMHAAVLTAMNCMPQDRHRAFWWVAAGLLDCLIYDGLPPELNAKKLLGRIDLHMKAFAEGAEPDERATLNEMLYLVACSHSVSNAVDEIKRCYALDQYLPEEPPLPPGETDQVLAQLRTRLNEATETWEKCAADAEACRAFAGQAEQIYGLSEKLDRNTLQLLCKQIHTAAVQSSDQEFRKRVTMDMAKALLLLDSGITRYTHLGDGYHEQVRLIGQNLQSGAAALSREEQEHLVQLHCQMEQREILPLLAQAMVGNLEQVEQELNSFFGNNGKREELSRLVRLLNQVQGCLHMLEMGASEQLVRNVKVTVERYAEGGAPAAAEMHAVATAISALGSYVHDLNYGQKPDSAPLEQLLKEITAPAPQPAAAASEQTDAAVGAVPAPAAEDNEMLEVFLEEAQEVLEILRTNLDLSQLHPDSNEPLVTIRRGFHTLKGSGRMVGLNDFGEVAWSVERAMNKWLQENKPATPYLLQFIADAEALFHAWVDVLRNRSGSPPDAAALVAAAQLVENGQAPEDAATAADGIAPPAAQPVAEMPAAPSPTAAEEAPEAATAGPGFALPDLQDVMPAAEVQPASQPETAPQEFSFESLSLSMDEEPAPEQAPAAAAEPAALDLGELSLPAVGFPAAGQDMQAEESTLEPLSLDIAAEAPAEAEPAPDLELAVPDLPELEIAAELPGATQEPEPVPEFSFDSLSLSMEEAQPLEVPVPAESDQAVLEQVATPEPLTAAELQTDQEENDAPAPTPEPSVPEQVEPAAPAASAQPEPDEDTVMVGSIALSATLFNIATEECASHLGRLQEYFAELRASRPPTVSYDFMRSAHTLAGVNRTMGFVAVADLSRALELWLQARIGKPFIMSAEQVELLEQAITTLDAMFLDICNHQEPIAQTQIIARLEAEQELLMPEPAPAARAVEPVLQEEVSEPVMPKSVWGAPAKSAPEPEPETAPAQEPEPAAESALESEPEPALEPETEAATPAAPETEQPIAPVAAVQEHETQPVSAHAEPGAAPRVRQYVEERTVQDEIDDQLLPIFLEESNDLQPQIGNTLRAWRADPDASQPGAELQRTLHTLKGSARMAGAMRLGELVHRMEDRVITGMKVRRDDAFWDELDNYSDRIGNALERLRGGGTSEPEAAAPAVEVQAPAQPVPEQEARPEPQPAAAAAAETAQPAESPAERAAAMLRVRSDTVDRLVNEAGEISVARSRIEAELRAFKTSLSDMSDSVAHLRKQLREIEIQAESQMEARVAQAKETDAKFDPLEFDRFTRFQELTRFMGESVHDVQTVQQTLLKNLDEVASAMSAQAYLNRDLQQSLMSIRMVPFSSIGNRLYRIVRQTSKELNKRANLDIQGGDVELDRSVLDRMTAPFEHLLRNAIAHGLESQEMRSSEGKPAVGQIQIALAQESNEVVFTVADDGAGINVNRLRQKAQEHGLVQPGASMSDEEAMLLIFNAGISTAAEVTEISGRGVGMDVVRNEIVSLGGQISVHSERGKGTRFTVRLPLTLAVAHILMTRAGPDHYAVPSVMVEQVLHVKTDALEAAYRAGWINWQGSNYPLRYLPHLLGHEEQQLESRMHNPVLLLRSGDQRMALHVDELFGNQETVVKNIGPQLSRMPGIAGATVLGSGRVVLILNPVALIQRVATVSKPAAVPAQPVEQVVEATPHAVPIVMVVDDSLTVRKVTSRMLTRAGYEVVTAKDGIDALEQLTQVTPAVMLLDVEMPRMDGFELTKQVRRDPNLHDIPILMITSRTAEKHRDYALELGVNAYFGKPFQEEELLQQISAFTGAHGKS